MTTGQTETGYTDKTVGRLLDMLRSGQWVRAGAADTPEIDAMLTRCADACFEINNMRPSLKAERRQALCDLLGKVGDNFVIHSPFRCECRDTSWCGNR